jgi:CDP-diacylglycerol--glycerol-3-phosphate 3-phosphatidyltransferase
VLLAGFLAGHPAGIRGQDGDTVIFPTVQLGQFGVRQDSEASLGLLNAGAAGGAFHLGSGYFNLTEAYCRALLGSPASVSVLMAHPEANGFLGAAGPAGGIPAAYTAIARAFWERVEAAGVTARVSLHEYRRPGWTFHAKGLWYSPPGDPRPCLTTVGSPNFGQRSVERDLETQMVIVTEDDGLRGRLAEERDGLFALGGATVTAATWQEEGRAVPAWVTAVVGIARNFF